MWLALLGPFCGRCGEAPVTVSAARQRAVLAILASRGGHVVSSAELVEAIWDGAPPAGARATIRAYVMRLRQALGPGLAVRVVTQSPGYLLQAAADEVDLLLFDRLCAEGAAAVRAEAWQRVWQLLGRALELWRGEPLADISCEALRRSLLPRLETQRLQATEWRLDAGLALGRHSELVAELTGLVGRHPLRERFWAQLMLALYRCGRQGEALGAYQRVRRLLVDELGVEPGHELQDLQRRILAADPDLRASAGETEAGQVPRTDRADRAPSAALAPRQLPAAVDGFTGRLAELDELDRLADDREVTSGAVVISAIGGTAGVGKTALAIHWAHRAADRFPDGQLYVNLRGFDAGGRATSAEEAVRGFLDALGVLPQRIPVSLDAQAALYRSLLAGRRVLVVLDNARDAEHIRQLLPGAPSAFAVVTSRNRLTSLVAGQGAHPLALDLLTPAEARELLARRLGADRIAAEPEAVDQIVVRCARLPLALTIAAARSAQSGFPLANVVKELAETDGVLDALSAGEPASRLRAVFSWSYATLSAPAARLFRLLALHPGPDIATAAAASLAGCARPAVRALLAELTGASMLFERAPGRYAFHDLLRVYGAELAHSPDADGERREAIRRMLDHYLHSANNADRMLNRARDPIPLPLAEPAAGVSPENPTDHAAAMAWFEVEQPILLAAAEQAVTLGLDAHAWQLPWTVDTFLYRQGRWRDLTMIWRAALVAASRLRDLSAEAYAHRTLARVATRVGRYQDALAQHHRALELYSRAGDLAGEAYTHQVLAMLWERQHLPARALTHARQALRLCETAGHRRGQAAASNAVGWYQALLGDQQQALTFCRRALALYQDVGDRDGEAHTWDSLGYAHHLTCQPQAADCYRRAVDLFHELGDHYQEAASLARLGDTRLAEGDHRAAHAAWRHALQILTELHHTEADSLRDRLTQLLPS